MYHRPSITTTATRAQRLRQVRGRHLVDVFSYSGTYAPITDVPNDLYDPGSNTLVPLEAPQVNGPIRSLDGHPNPSIVPPEPIINVTTVR